MKARVWLLLCLLLAWPLSSLRSGWRPAASSTGPIEARMTAAPARQMATPIRSKRSGRTPSTTASQASAMPI